MIESRKGIRKLPKGRRRRVSTFVLTAMVLAVVAATLVMLAGMGSRWGWWHFRTGFTILRWGTVCGVIAVVASFAALVVSLQQKASQGILPALLGLAVALPTTAIPLHWMQLAKSVPPIHDITTDTENPPRFVAVLPLRKEAANPAEYGGPDVAARQLAAYPEIVPLMLDMPPPRALERALRAARKLGWEIVSVDSAAGRIEATDTTFWFGFKDDIVIRVSPLGNGSRIDIRSVSRVGKSDVGTNARRIRAFLREVRKGG